MVSSVERDHFSVFCRLNLKRVKKGTFDKYAHSIKQEENKINATIIKDQIWKGVILFGFFFHKMKYKTHITKAKGRRKPIFQEKKLLLEDEKCKRPFSALGLMTL